LFKITAAAGEETGGALLSVLYSAMQKEGDEVLSLCCLFVVFLFVCFSSCTVPCRKGDEVLLLCGSCLFVACLLLVCCVFVVCLLLVCCVVVVCLPCVLVFLVVLLVPCPLSTLKHQHTYLTLLQETRSLLVYLLSESSVISTHVAWCYASLILHTYIIPRCPTLIWWRVGSTVPWQTY
jgi:hypothetical protein